MLLSEISGRAAGSAAVSGAEEACAASEEAVSGAADTVSGAEDAACAAWLEELEAGALSDEEAPASLALQAENSSAKQSGKTHPIYFCFISRISFPEKDRGMIGRTG